MKKKFFLVLFLVLFLSSCVTVIHTKLDVEGNFYVYSVYETVDMKGTIPPDIEVQFHFEFELHFNDHACTITNVNYITVNNNVAERSISQNIFDYKINNNQIFLSNGIVFDFAKGGLVCEVNDHEMFFKFSGSITK